MFDKLVLFAFVALVSADKIVIPDTIVKTKTLVKGPSGEITQEEHLPVLKPELTVVKPEVAILETRLVKPEVKIVETPVVKSEVAIIKPEIVHDSIVVESKPEFLEPIPVHPLHPFLVDPVYPSHRFVFEDLTPVLADRLRTVPYAYRRYYL